MAPAAIPLERPALGAIPVSYNMDECFLNNEMAGVHNFNPMVTYL